VCPARTFSEKLHYCPPITLDKSNGSSATAEGCDTRTTGNLRCECLLLFALLQNNFSIAHYDKKYSIPRYFPNSFFKHSPSVRQVFRTCEAKGKLSILYTNMCLVVFQIAHDEKKKNVYERTKNSALIFHFHSSPSRAQ
jgi:hypothetical protein